MVIDEEEAESQREGRREIEIREPGAVETQKGEKREE